MVAVGPVGKVHCEVWWRPIGCGCKEHKDLPACLPVLATSTPFLPTAGWLVEGMPSLPTRPDHQGPAGRVSPGGLDMHVA